ncbi:hypothetical protein Tcan_07049 [Toxocara canis]|uniref:Uncharacterized protein n=1 Tax=Toxocara canis TaxID=6265 RepID=A0A0B2UT78_TOXCA|nr:hypothetical protein Tcan_07049 [Toxocara canis]
MLITSNEHDTSSGQANPTEWPSDIIIRTPRIQDSMTMLSPFRPNILYTVFPTLQSKSSPYYCEQNQHNFQITCLPGKALRYDLRMDGIVLNQDINLGILGQRMSTRPAHSMTTAALSYGYPLLDILPANKLDDSRAQNELLDSFVVPNFSASSEYFSEHEPLLASDDTWRRSTQRNYSPGYEAVERGAPVKSIKTDQDDTRLPWPLG